MVLHPRAPASRSSRNRRRTPFPGSRLACRAVAPYHVVKMRRHSLRSSFLRNYREALSFSLRVVGVPPPHPRTIASFYNPGRFLYNWGRFFFVKFLYKFAPSPFVNHRAPMLFVYKLVQTLLLSGNCAEKFCSQRRQKFSCP